jgi:hypothetical protein
MRASKRCGDFEDGETTKDWFAIRFAAEAIGSVRFDSIPSIDSFLMMMMMMMCLDLWV